MSEFEIYHLAQLNFINNAIYTVVVVMLTALAFYLIRRREELDLPPYSKIIMTGFCACVAFFGIQVNSFLATTQKGLSYQLSELKTSGTAISSTAQNWIDFVGYGVTEGPPALAPDLPSIIFWLIISFMFIGGIWFPRPAKK